MCLVGFRRGDRTARWAGVRRRIRARRVVVDLAWLRATPWRERLAASFDPPDRMARLQDLETVSIRHRLGSRASGLLLAGWLASRVRWEPGSALPGAGYRKRRARQVRTRSCRDPVRRRSRRSAGAVPLHVLLPMAAMWSASKTCVTRACTRRARYSGRTPRWSPGGSSVARRARSGRRIVAIALPGLRRPH